MKKVIAEALRLVQYINCTHPKKLLIKSILTGPRSSKDIYECNDCGKILTREIK